MWWFLLVADLYFLSVGVRSMLEYGPDQYNIVMVFCFSFFLGNYTADFHDAGFESGKAEFGDGLCNTRFLDLLGRRDCFSFNGYGKYSLLDECYYVRVLRVDSGLYLEGVENGESLRIF